MRMNNSIFILAVQDTTKLLSLKWDTHSITLWGTSLLLCTQRDLFLLQSICCNW